MTDDARLSDPDIRGRKASGPCRRPIALGIASILAGIVLFGGAIVATVTRSTNGDRSTATLRDGLSAVKAGDMARARTVIRGLRDRAHDDEAAIVQAAILLSKDLCEPAVAVLARAPDGGALATSRSLLLAEAAHRRGRHREVAAILLPLVDRQPDAVDAHRLLAASFYDTGAIDASLRHLHQVARLAPSDPRPHRLMGLMHNDFERFDEAIPLYEESLRRDPDQPDRNDVRRELAACLIAQRRFDEAISVLDRPGEHSPADDVLRAECQLALGERDAALERLEQAMIAMGDGPASSSADARKALVLIGSLHLEDGNPEAAIPPLERAASDPHDYRAHHVLARALAAAGRDDVATECAARAEAIRERRHRFAELHREAWEHPWDPDVRLRLADAAAAIGRPDLEQVWRAAAEGVAGTDAVHPAAQQPDTALEAEQ